VLFRSDVIRDVTHPAAGLPTQKDFLPTVREVFVACEEIMRPRREAEARRLGIQKQLAEREEWERKRKA
jgi:hypothetical protein